ncbi:MAG: class II aldolase/adducin family protein [Proteobacteria bacterium]|nr:class II aldolase/adducin family protein [Pseudomonadota bacterium]
MAVTQLKPKGNMSEAEWQTRCDLAALYRILARFRMTDFIYTHLSARVPGEEGTFLLNEYGEPFDKVTASSLVKLDFDGNVIGDGEFNQAGFTIHSAVLMARPDVNAVTHVHTRASVAVSAQKRGLLPISQQAMIVLGHVSYHDYEGVALDLDERERLGADLGDKRAMILRNHGLLTAAETIPAAWQLLYWLDCACQIQIDAMAGGSELIKLPMDIADGMMERYKQKTGHGEREWKAVLQMLDGENYAR